MALNDIYNLFQVHSLYKPEEILADLKILANGDVRDELKDIQTLAKDLLESFSVEPQTDDTEQLKHLFALLPISDLSRLTDLDAQGNINQEAVKLVFSELEMLRAATGSAYELYRPEEVRDILKAGDGNFDILRMFYTCYTALIGQDTRKYAEEVIPLLTLDSFLNHTSYTWEEILLVSLFIKLCWKAFPNLVYDDQMDLIKFTFYRAIVVGVPVRKILEEYLKESWDLYEYLIRHGYLIKVLEQCQDKVPQDVSASKFDNLANLYSAARSTTGGWQINQKVEELYTGQAGREKYTQWLLEALYLMMAIKQAKLVEYEDFTKVHDEKLFTPFDHELTQLMEWFLFERDWPKIVEYFKSNTGKISLVTFFRCCKTRFDLSEESATEIFIKFVDFIHKAGIVSSDFEVLEFHEEDNKMHWRQDL